MADEAGHNAGRADITAVVLAGGRATRMGGLDKGLQLFRGQPLALHAARRVQPQVAGVLLNANRNLPAYAAWGLAVLPDAHPGHCGPLAGFAAALAHCPTPWLLALPCDTPRFPADLATRLMQAATQARAPVASACAPDPDAHGQLRTHAAFCLMQVALLDDLQAFLAAGGRRVQQWSARHGGALAVFDRPGDDPHAFANANTLQQLQQLQQASVFD